MAPKWPRKTVMNSYFVQREPIFKLHPLTHKQKVLDLYRDAMRSIRWRDIYFPYPNRIWDERHLLLQLRKRFEDNRNIKDYRVAKRLLEDGKKELFDHRPMPVQWTYSPGGVQYCPQYHNVPDVMLDLWHPLEKSQYPYYFARREQRKLEYIKLYEGEWGKAEELIGLESGPDGGKDYHKLIEEFMEEVHKMDKAYDASIEEEKKKKAIEV